LGYHQHYLQQIISYTDNGFNVQLKGFLRVWIFQYLCPHTE
jgi:hypothetical protein